MKQNTNLYAWPLSKRLRYVVRRGASLAGFLARFALASRGEERQQTFDKLCDFMVAAGGVYTKFLQGVLLGVPEVQDWVKRRQVDFFENVPPENLDVDKVVNRELGEGASRLKIEPDILASGTFSQVYSGVLDFYIPVVIKIQRQTIRPSLKADVWLLKRFARYGRPFLTTLDADTRTMSRDFARITIAEMDYKREARLGETLRERVSSSSSHSNLVVPQTFTDVSTDHVLIQERLSGISVAEIMRRGAPSAEYRQMLRDMIVTVLLLPFTTGLVHADPHPGNVRLMEDGRIALLDFGAIDDKPVDLKVYRRLLIATVKAMEGTMTAAEALDAYFAAYAPRLYKAMEITSQALGLPPVLPMLASASMGKDLAEEPQAGFKGSLLALADINKKVNPGNRFMLRSSIQNISYARAVHTVMQTMQVMGLKDDIIIALRYIYMRMLEDDEPVWASGEANDNLSIVEAKEIVYSWLERVLQKNPLMINELSGVFEKVKQSLSER